MRHAIITAGTKGLGRKVTEHMLARGYSVTVTYFNDEPKAQTLLNDFASARERIQLVKADVTVEQDLERVVQQAVDRYGRIDFLINNAGPYIFERKKLMDYTKDEWNQMIRGNLDAVFYLLKLTVPHMRRAAVRPDHQLRVSRRPCSFRVDISIGLCCCKSRAGVTDQNNRL